MSKTAHLYPLIFTALTAVTSCHSAKRYSGNVVHGVSATAKKIGGGAAKLWPWKGTPKPPPTATSQPTNPSAPPAAPPPRADIPNPFPAGPQLVTDAELGDSSTSLQTTTTTLPGGWVVQGTSVSYHLDAGAETPRILRALGTPASAISANGDTATAKSVHYRSKSGVLILLGDPTLKTSGQTLKGQGPNTSIKIHIPTGAITVDGPTTYQ